MLLPKRTKFRKFQKGRAQGLSGNLKDLTYGSYCIKAQTPGKMSARLIETFRRTLTRSFQRKGKVWIRVFPHKPVTKKPAETRQGKGKGPVDHWVAVVKPGHVLFEIAGCSLTLAREALGLADAKLPFRCRLVQRQQSF